MYNERDYEIAFEHSEENGEDNISLDEYCILLDEFLNEFSEYI